MMRESCRGNDPVRTSGVIIHYASLLIVDGYADCRRQLRGRPCCVDWLRDGAAEESLKSSILLWSREIDHEVQRISPFFDNAGLKGEGCSVNQPRRDFKSRDVVVHPF